MFPSPHPKSEYRIGYKELRTLVGLVGMLSPILLMGVGLLKGIALPSSLSAYYHTNMIVPFVGSLWVIAFFMTSYRGYGSDWLWGNLVAVFAVGVTIFPIEADCSASSTWSTLHSICALSYFSILTYFSGFLFTRSDKPPHERGSRKKLRNAIYRTCAIIMAGCIVAVVVFEFKGDSCAPNQHTVLWAESLAIFSFGVSWFVKAGVILKDRE